MEKTKIYDKKFLLKLLIALLLFVLAIVSNTLSSKYINKVFGEPKVIRDLLWERLPYLPNILIISEIVIAISVIYLIYWSFKKDINYIPYILYMWFSFQILRAGIIIFTPMGFPQAYTGLVPIGSDSVFSYGSFPSGHLAYPFLTYLVTRSKKVIILCLISVFSLLASHGHYTIDLFGTFFIGFTLWSIFEKDIKRYVV